MKVEDVVIIGAGPAGIAAAIQLRRYEVQPVLLERQVVGGLLRNANLVENYPGFPDGIAGLDLIGLFEKQLHKCGIDVHFEEVQNLEYEDGIFIILTNLRTFKSRIIVVASGTKPRKIDDFIIPKELEDRVYYEIHPIREIENKKVAIIGAGDAGFDYALNLSRRNDVFVLNRNRSEKCIPVLWQRAVKDNHITYMNEVSVRAVEKEKDLLSLTYQSKSEKIEKIHVDYIIIAVGREPRLNFIGNKLNEDVNRLIIDGLIYFIGDVQNDRYRQTAICVGDGVKAAMMIYEKLRSVA